MIIVIDGPSGSGKSTLAKRLAKELHFDFFDTGAMYRSVCYFLMQRNVSLDQPDSIQKVLGDFQYDIRGKGDQTQFYVNGEDVSEKIRTREVTNQVSVVAAYSFVREKLVDLQKQFGEKGNAVFEGRDMGTVVFPKADVKFYLIASAQVRAKRRFEQLKELYPNSTFDLKQIESEIIRRDEIDSTRAHSPLKKASDAIEIDSSNLSIEEVLNLMLDTVRKKNDE